MAGFSGSVGDIYNQGYYIAGNAVDPQFPVRIFIRFSTRGG